jgi:hypothetical protein
MSSRLCRLLPFAAFPIMAIAACLMSTAVGAEKGDDPKEALQELQEYIGGWKGAVDKGSAAWKESANWSWRFANKGKDVYMTVDMPDSKVYKSGEMRFLSDKGKYQFTLTDTKDKKTVYLGDIKKGKLVLERTTDAKGIEQIEMKTAAGGVRLIYTFSKKSPNSTLYTKDFQIAYTKEGESFGVAAGQKGPECVVTGGLGTMQVSYMGMTYYVCCTGCRDAFNENPAKIIAEYKAKKAKGQ